MTLVVDTSCTVRKYHFNLLRSTEAHFAFSAEKRTDLNSCLVQAVLILGGVAKFSS